MKNKLMRLASVMLVLTLLTTCGVSGTYAKYVTTASASDTARVAKFGVEITSQTNSLFAKTYTSDSAYAGNTVVSVDEVVAPGTKKDDGSINITITGTPEVAVEVAYDLTVNSDVFVKAGTYYDYTTADDTTDTFSRETDYYPLRFTLKKGDQTVVDKQNLQQVRSYFYNNKEQFAPGTDLSTVVGEYTLSWEWAFNATSTDQSDESDTLLGQVAAGKAVGGTDANVSTTLAFDFAVTVTQID